MKRISPQGAAFTMPALVAVNLIPPEASAARRARQTRKLSVMATVGVVAGLALGYGAVEYQAASADDERRRSETRVSELQAQVKRYAEVVQVREEIARTEAALHTAMAYEVELTPIIQAIQATLPAGASVVEFKSGSMSATQEVVEGPNVLAPPGVGRIEMTVAMASLPDVSAWMDRLDAVEGLMGASYSQAQRQDAEGNPVWSVSFTVEISLDGLSGEVLKAKKPTEQTVGDGK